MKHFVVFLCGLLLPLPPARAEVISTDAGAASVQRALLRAEMEKMGVSADDASARVEALTNEEVLRLQGRLGQADAGRANDRSGVVQLLLLFILGFILLVLI
jgi:hypothetical protein